MEIISPLLFALAVSSDGFMAGIAYGAKRIHIPVFSSAVVALASALAVTFSMICGKGLAAVIPEVWATRIGAFILIAIGIYFLLGACRDKIISLQVDEEKPLISFNIRSLGIIVQILREPSSADMDCSGEISTKEAFFLGLALALDALGAGIGVAMAGLNILLTAIAVGMLKFILVNSGLYLGAIIINPKLKITSQLIPGLILITIGLLEYI
ncbi:MAG: sporulation membrane protein YtaF [Syntrophomonadaceae bacterium]|nr:sporulation membrane protein YtaF [Syntrophomonadaceae bacterium]